MAQAVARCQVARDEVGHDIRMIIRIAVCALVVAVLLLPGGAGAVEVHYDAYAAGVRVVSVDADFDVSAERYRVRLDYRTVGALSVVFGSRLASTATGRFVATRAIPERFYATGMLRGTSRLTDMGYAEGRPVVRQLVPPNETEREAVAPERQRDTVDTLSAMAELVRVVNETGRCDGRVTTFDGRRLSVLEVRTSGAQGLEATGRSSFMGMTLRCDFVGQQLGGFMLDEERSTLAKPQVGTAWFATVAPGGLKVPVRIAFRTRWFGEATMYLAAKS